MTTAPRWPGRVAGPSISLALAPAGAAGSSTLTPTYDPVRHRGVDTAGSAGTHGWSRQRSADVLFGCLALAALAAALFQNLFRLAAAPLLVDEPYYTGMGWRYAHWNSLSQAAQAPIASNGEHPPLAKLLFGVAEVATGHESIPAARAVSATCTVAAALVLAFWLGLVVNRWLGLLAGSMLGLIPMSVFPDVTRFGRTATLDPVAGFFMVTSLVIGWAWFRSRGRAGWVLAASAGAAVGLGSASKVNACLGLVGPVLLGIIGSWPSMKWIGKRVVQTMTAVVVSLMTFLVCYAPLGAPHERIQYMIDFQSKHSADGHPVGFAGRISWHPPWWANLWFAGQGLGTVLSWALPITALAALVLRRDRLVAWCAASLVVPLVFHCYIAGVVLPFYWVLWTPALVALSAIGIWEMLTRVRAALPAGLRVVAGLAASAALVGVLIPSLEQTAEVATLHPEGAHAASTLRAGLGLHGSIVSSGSPYWEMRPYLGTAILTRVPRDLRPVDTILLGQPRCGQSVRPDVRALVMTNLRRGSVRLARTDRLMSVYVVVGTLHAPTAAEIKAQPLGRGVRNC